MTFTEILHDLSIKLAIEGLAEDFSISLPENIFYRLCWEIQKHSGKYVRHHDDGSIEEGKTTHLILSVPSGQLFITSRK
jgi:hypothetical protein